jgi:hypothetical protein
MGKVTNLRRFLLPLFVFIFAFSLGFGLKAGVDYLAQFIPEANTVSAAVDTYISWKYAQRFEAVQETFAIDPLWGIFIINTITYSMNLWLGPMCFWITGFFKEEKTPPVIRNFIKKMNQLLLITSRKTYTELLFLYLAPLTLVFWLGFDGGLFNNLTIFTHPHAWIEFFVAFYSASLGLSLSEVSMKKAIQHFIVLIPIIFIAALLEYPLLA